MIDLFDVLKRRDAGYGRIAFVHDHAAGLRDAVLVRFGLHPLRSHLRATDRAEALIQLSCFLARDMAYSDEVMIAAEADRLANTFIESVAQEGAIFYVNQEVLGPTASAYVQMTDATFDAGIIVENPDHTYACVWFEDED